MYTYIYIYVLQNRKRKLQLYYANSVLVLLILKGDRLSDTPKIGDVLLIYLLVYYYGLCQTFFIIYRSKLCDFMNHGFVNRTITEQRSQ